MASKRIGTAILSLGILYMILVSWLISWWYVPDYRQFGPGFVSGSSWYTSTPFNIVWAVSAPLGSILVIFGFALSVGIEKRHAVYFVIASIILLLWLALWQVSSITSALYGIGGGIIIICFLVCVRSWAKKRVHLEGRGKLAADVRILGHLFFLIAAWGLCGLRGAPMFGLRPKLMAEYGTQPIDMGAKVLICIAVGWICSAISQHLETDSDKRVA